MSIYKFRKWFFDIVGGQEDYLTLFFSQVKIGNNCRTSFQMHGSKRGPNQSFIPHISCAKILRQKEDNDRVLLFDEGEMRFADRNCLINLEFDNYKVILVFNTDEIRWPDGISHFYNQKKKIIDWIPLILISNVSGSVKTHGDIMVFNNAQGYCDEVLSTVLPWKVPSYQLYWGRLHHEKLNFSYSIMFNRDTLPFASRLFLGIMGHYYILDRFSFDIIQHKKSKSMNLLYADKYIINGNSGDLNITIEVLDHEEMILNDFMDYASEYGEMITGILKWISGDPHGIKFRANANINILRNNESYRMERVSLVDEYVEFRK